MMEYDRSYIRSKKYASVNIGDKKYAFIEDIPTDVGTEGDILDIPEDVIYLK